MNNINSVWQFCDQLNSESIHSKFKNAILLHSLQVWILLCVPIKGWVCQRCVVIWLINLHVRFVSQHHIVTFGSIILCTYCAVIVLPALIKAVLAQWITSVLVAILLPWLLKAAYMRTTQRAPSHNHVTLLGYQVVWCNSKPLFEKTSICLLSIYIWHSDENICIHMTKITWLCAWSPFYSWSCSLVMCEQQMYENEVFQNNIAINRFWLDNAHLLGNWLSDPSLLSASCICT